MVGAFALVELAFEARQAAGADHPSLSQPWAVKSILPYFHMETQAISAHQVYAGTLSEPIAPLPLSTICSLHFKNIGD